MPQQMGMAAACRSQLPLPPLLFSRAREPALDTGEQNSAAVGLRTRVGAVGLAYLLGQNMKKKRCAVRFTIN